MAEIHARQIEDLLRREGPLTAAALGQALGVSQRTVEAHRANVLQKLGISNTASLVRLAVLAGMGPPQG